MFQGFCDVFLKCRAVDAEGPLARLKNMLFNPHTLYTLGQWALVSITFAFFIAISYLMYLHLYIHTYT